ncbi:myosin-binding protein H-like isoform X2 [Prionailurus viverrinus]|uniref:myosin-binding protein H-like isoform X2 n=1 Tax=Prionailurus viverrinus TaxID=61388 RepID=UPI001FF2D4EE|nr:myosin-binding protein H-like isoform X2 [Prionailurus viverrinus]XP_047729643.1 myosin-binding protein H-like isoform X2 [Prionailurus viverrinus]XP_047729644.1 myosin-binding protein H-like isoform X2 [Prionailurus viverrinus]
MQKWGRKANPTGWTSLCKQKKEISVNEESVAEHYKLKEVSVRLTFQCFLPRPECSPEDISANHSSRNFSETKGAIFPSPRRGLICRAPGASAHGAQPGAVSTSSELCVSHYRRLTTHCSLSFCHSEHPKIWLPRALRQTYIRKVGDTVNLLIPFQGKPKPQATWTHDGCALDAGRVSVRNGERDSILFIREAQRADSGRYQLSVRLGELEATATIDILVIERPGPPQSIKLVDVWGSNATLEWTPPQDTGNTALLGYTVQKADTKSGLWFTVLERYHRTSFTVSNLIVGNSYAFRVFAENQCGLSETAPITADLAHIQKAATLRKTGGFAQRDFSEAPKFTQPLADCTTVMGYDTQLFCCVRASPKPKIIWLKNKMDIQGNPKYRALTHLGICSLEIRKPGPFDGGIYTCKAVNPLGEASVDCRVDVRAPH